MQLKKKIIILGLIAAILGAVVYSHSESHFPLYPYIDTTFSKNFTWDKFNNVTVGMNKREVTGILGKPLRKFNSDVTKPNECWEYTTDGKLQPYADFSWYSVKVCFTKDIVLSKPINEFSD